MEYSQVFRTNMLAEMHRQKINAAELSKRAGLNARAVKDIEEGRSQSPKIDTAGAIAQALGFELGAFLQRPPRGRIVRELSEFLSLYDEQDQRTILAAILDMSSVLQESPDKASRARSRQDG